MIAFAASPLSETTAQEVVRDLILSAYAKDEQAA